MLRAIIFLLVFSEFWVLPGVPKTTQNRFFPKKNVPGNAILSTFAANCVHLDFLDDFSSILNEIWEEKSMVFPSRPRISPPCQNHAFCRLPCMESVFLRKRRNRENNIFLLRNRWKKQLEIWPAEKVKKQPPGSPKIDPRLMKIGRERSESPKIKKKWFFEDLPF